MKVILLIICGHNTCIMICEALDTNFSSRSLFYFVDSFFFRWTSTTNICADCVIYENCLVHNNVSNKYYSLYTLLKDKTF